MYAVSGQTIVGKWDVAHAAYLEFGAAGSADTRYLITVELNEKRGCYEFTERTSDDRTADRADTDRRARVVFGGRAFGGRAVMAGNGVTPALTHSFCTTRITEPLFTFLEGNGYSRKKGFLGGLFDR